MKNLIDQFNENWLYNIHMDQLKELHENTNKNDLIKIIVKLMDKYNLLYKQNKEDKKAIESYTYDLVNYLEENDYELLDREEIDNYIAWIQNYCN